MYQSAELAALEDDALGKLPTLRILRDQLYSKEFREFIQAITGCGELTERIDCSVNAYANGCHLLTHDDVIGTRCVSYIIYLTDPDRPWTAADGGAVELFPLDPISVVNTGGTGAAGEQGVPMPVPTRCILPTFNTMLLFTVQPGRSYHAVQEVFSHDKPRFSISGWYHAVHPPVGSDRSSLMQIMTTGDDHRPFQQYPAGSSAPGSSGYKHLDNNNNNSSSGGRGSSTEKENAGESNPTFGHSEIEQLKKWVNPRYLVLETLAEVNEEFCADSSLQLSDFLRADLASAISKYSILADHEQRVGKGNPQLDYTLGQASQSWVLVGPPHKRRYLQFTDASGGTEDAIGAENKQGGKRKSIDAAADGCFSAAALLISRSKPSIKWGKIADEIFDLYSPSAGSGQAACATVGHLLTAVRQQLFHAPAFGSFLATVTTLLPRGFRSEVRRFRAGLDYTVAHYGVLTKEARLDATLCFVNESEEVEESVLKSFRACKTAAGATEKRAKLIKAEESGADCADGADGDDDNEGDDDERVPHEDAWDSGDVGGFECYIEADEDPENSEAAEVYRVTNANPAERQQHKNKSDAADAADAADEGNEEDPTTSLLSVSASNNVLSLVMRDEGIMKFIKYLSANAPGSRWDVAVEYEIENSGDSEDSEDSEDGNDSDDSDGNDSDDSDGNDDNDSGKEDES